MLNRKKGASPEKICKDTDWQPHSVRAFLTSLRKKDFVIAREQRDKDAAAYRIIQSPVKPATADAA